MCYNHVHLLVVAGTNFDFFDKLPLLEVLQKCFGNNAVTAVLHHLPIRLENQIWVLGGIHHKHRVERLALFDVLAHDFEGVGRAENSKLNFVAIDLPLDVDWVVGDVDKCEVGNAVADHSIEPRHDVGRHKRVLARLCRKPRQKQGVVQSCGNLAHAPTNSVGVGAVQDDFGVLVATLCRAFAHHVVERKRLPRQNCRAVDTLRGKANVVGTCLVFRVERSEKRGFLHHVLPDLLFRDGFVHNQRQVELPTAKQLVKQCVNVDFHAILATRVAKIAVKRHRRILLWFFNVAKMLQNAVEIWQHVVVDGNVW